LLVDVGVFLPDPLDATGIPEVGVFRPDPPPATAAGIPELGVFRPDPVPTGIPVVVGVFRPVAAEAELDGVLRSAAGETAGLAIRLPGEAAEAGRVAVRDTRV
jgi:hypothetical protein